MRIPHEMTMKKSKPYEKMTSRELAAATKEFDEPFVMDKGRALNPAERRLHRRAAKRGRGRPKIGKGAERINLTVERSLLEAADALAKRSGRKRSELFADGLKMLLTHRGSTPRRKAS
jgi:hypothetical protein